jgi:hypothetical protein
MLAEFLKRSWAPAPLARAHHPVRGRRPRTLKSVCCLRRVCFDAETRHRMSFELHHHRSFESLSLSGRSRQSGGVGGQPDGRLGYLKLLNFKKIRVRGDPSTRYLAATIGLVASGQSFLVKKAWKPLRYFGFHSLASRCASAICAGVILAATASRYKSEPARSNHL